MQTSMLNRRLTDRIKELCERVQDHTEPQWDSVLRELQAAIQEHTLRLYNLGAATTLAGAPNSVRERRRSADDLRERKPIRYVAFGNLNTRKLPFSAAATASRHNASYGDSQG